MRHFVITFLVAASTLHILNAQELRFVPAAASAVGAGGSFFVTDVRVFNPDPESPLTVSASLLRRDTDNSGAPQQVFEVASRSGVAFDDVLASLFGGDGTGGLVFEANRPFYVTTRTYNAGGDAGTFGQFIPGQSPSEALASGILLSVLNQPGANGFRSNVGFANPTGSPIGMTVRVYDLAGDGLLGMGTRTLPPFAVTQINDVFAFVGAADHATANASVEFVADAPVLAYASVIDNLSNDPVYVLPDGDVGTSETQNGPPDGTIVAPADDVTIETGDDVLFTATASDPDGDAVTVLWDFGDGITATGLTPEAHTFSDAGTYEVTLTATDSHGAVDPSPDTRTVTVTERTTVTFSQVQSQIFNQSCAFSGCHAGNAPAAGQNLSEGQAYANIVGIPSSERPALSRIEPFDPESSYMYLKVIGDPSIAGGQMPLGGPFLADATIAMLRDWIEAGAPNN
jgi:hypothetical protein